MARLADERTDRLLRALQNGMPPDRLSRGHALYRAGRVPVMEVVMNTVYGAVHDGTVHAVTLDADDMAYSTCTCPEEEWCAHMAALVFRYYESAGGDADAVLKILTEGGSLDGDGMPGPADGPEAWAEWFAGRFGDVWLECRRSLHPLQPVLQEAKGKARDWPPGMRRLHWLQTVLLVLEQAELAYAGSDPANRYYYQLAFTRSTEPWVQHWLELLRETGPVPAGEAEERWLRAIAARLREAALNERYGLLRWDELYVAWWDHFAGWRDAVLGEREVIGRLAEAIGYADAGARKGSASGADASAGASAAGTSAASASAASVSAADPSAAGISGTSATAASAAGASFAGTSAADPSAAGISGTSATAASAAGASFAGTSAAGISGTSATAASAAGASFAGMSAADPSAAGISGTSATAASAAGTPDPGALSLSSRETAILTALAFFRFRDGDHDGAIDAMRRTPFRHTWTIVRRFAERCLEDGDFDMLERWMRFLHERLRQIRDAAALKSLLALCRAADERWPERPLGIRLMREWLPLSYGELSTLYLSRGRLRDWADLQLAMGIRPEDLDAGHLRRVAKEAPELLLPLFHRAVDEAVRSRGRAGYRAAVRHLKRLEKLYRAAGRQERWREFIRQFRTRHARLRALQEELRYANLTGD